MLYKHVLFKDLHDYIKKTDYFNGYTETEKAWVRKNLGILGEKDFQLLYNDQQIALINNEELKRLIDQKDLKIGHFYMIPYLEQYKLLLLAITNKEFSKNVLMFTDNPNSLLWEVKYDLEKVTYLKDENGNEANFDFKNIKINNRYTFQNINGSENSEHCFGNNLTQCTNVYFTGNSNNNFIIGNNVTFNIPVNNTIGTANDITINTDEIGLDNDLVKQFIKINNNYYLDYLDLETLTHQFYALDTVQ